MVQKKVYTHTEIKQMWKNVKICWIWVKDVGVTCIILAVFLEVKLFQNKVIFKKSASMAKVCY